MAKILYEGFESGTSGFVSLDGFEVANGVTMENEGYLAPEHGIYGIIQTIPAYTSHWQLATYRDDLTLIYFKMRMQIRSGSNPSIFYLSLMSEDGLELGKIQYNSTLHGFRYVTGSRTALGTLTVDTGSWFVIDFVVLLSTDYYTADGYVFSQINGIPDINQPALITTRWPSRHINQIQLTSHGYTVMDDFVLGDSDYLSTWNSYVVRYSPSADQTTDWTRNTGSSPFYTYVNNYGSSCDDLYTLGTTSGQLQDYSVISSESTFTSIEGVQLGVRSQKCRPVNDDLIYKGSLSIDGTLYQEPIDLGHGLGMSYRFNKCGKLWEQNPDTSLPWTELDLSASNFYAGVLLDVDS